MDRSSATDPSEAPGPTTGSGLAAERVRRLGRVDELRTRGDQPYPYRFDRSHTLAGTGTELLQRPEIRAAYLEGGRHG